MIEIFRRFAFFGIVFPFVSPFVLKSSDLQPFVFLFIVLILIFERFKLGLLIFVAALFALLVFHAILVAPGPILLILFAFLGFQFGFRFGLLIQIKFLRILCVVFIAQMMMHFFFPLSFTSLFGWLVSDLRVEIPFAKGRGTSGLFPEPGFAGAQVVFLLCWLKAIPADNKNLYDQFVGFGLLVCVILSGSGSGVIFLILFCIGLAVRYMNSRTGIFTIISSLILLFLILPYASEILIGRGKIAFDLIMDPGQLIQSDRSMGMRVFNFVLAYEVLVNNFGGLGSEGFKRALDMYSVPGQWQEIAHGANLSSIAYLIVSYGWFAVIAITFSLIFFGKMMWEYSSTAPLIFVASGFFLFSFSLAYPGGWFLLGMACAQVRAERERRFKLGNNVHEL